MDQGPTGCGRETRVGAVAEGWAGPAVLGRKIGRTLKRDEKRVGWGTKVQNPFLRREKNRVRNLRAEKKTWKIVLRVLDSPQGINNKPVKDGEEEQTFMLQLIRVDVDQVDRRQRQSRCEVIWRVGPGEPNKGELKEGSKATQKRS